MRKLIIILLICVVNFSELKSSPDYCPKYCHCDLYKNFNRANCSAQKLFSSYLNISENVEILDLSQNAITILGNKCFEGLHYLLNLTLAYNNIHTIYLDAFSPLEKVQFIDLSNNPLEYFNHRIIENNHKLVSLNLAGNKFMSLQNKPLLKSTSLQYLSLRNSQIPHIYQTLFEELPSLLKLDISENLLTTLTSIPLNHLQKLKFLDLQRNRWICDRNTESTVKVLKRKNIDVRLDKCNFDAGQTKQMFERMVMLRDSTTETSTKRTKTNIEYYEATRCHHLDTQELCSFYQRYLVTLINYKNQQLAFRKTSSSPIIYCSNRVYKDYLCMGIFVGAVLTGGLQLSIYLIQKLLAKRKIQRQTYVSSVPTLPLRRRGRRTNQGINENYRVNLAPRLILVARNENSDEENDYTRQREQRSANSGLNRDETFPNSIIIRPVTPPPDYKDVVPI